MLKKNFNCYFRYIDIIKHSYYLEGAGSKLNGQTTLYITSHDPKDFDRGLRSSAQ